MMILYPYGLRKALTLSYDDGVETDIELIRIIACFFVIFNHTGENGFFLFSLQNRGSVPFWMDLMISICPRRHVLPCRHDLPPHE